MTTTRSQRRILQEIKRDQPESGTTEPNAVTFYTVNDNCSELRGEFMGPPDTPYEGGKFVLDIKVPEAYPYIPPEVRFITKIWHPNISSVTGFICLDILGKKWAAALSLRTVLLSVQSMLADAQLDSPQDAVVAVQYKNHHSLYVTTAKHWTNVYAGGPHVISDYDAKVRRLTTMGVDPIKARAELSKYNWDVEMAMRSQFK